MSISDVLVRSFRDEGVFLIQTFIFSMNKEAFHTVYKWKASLTSTRLLYYKNPKGCIKIG